ncbi:MAG: fibronectin type III domain-containing protein [Candidatus Nanopelagicales bacterium]
MHRRLTLIVVASASLAFLGLPLVAPPPTSAVASPPCAPRVGSAGTDVVLTFDDTTAGGCQWTVPAGLTQVRVLVVAGGGGGAVNYRGGGGGGGMLEEAALSVSPGSLVSISVGAGGAGAYYGPAYTGWWHNQHDNTVNATNGGVSSFGSVTALGGGFASGAYSPAINAGSGGSGGGSTGGVAGLGTPGQGYAGSNVGGGGGAGAAATGTAGASGRASDITGVSVLYGGGGGRQGAAGGSGGGGAGQGFSGATFAGAGTDGLGGGGGGGGYFPDGSRAVDWSNDTSIGGRGGSGVVIVRYPALYTVTYDPNQATSGTPPAAQTQVVSSLVTVATNSGNLARAGYDFVGWNDDSTGSGASYTPGTGTFTLSGNRTLYAQWRWIPPPPQSPPSTPYLREARPGNRSATLTWIRPDDPGTSPIIEYRVYSPSGGLMCTVPARTWATYTCTVSGLTNGTAYDFRVVAVNAVGESPPSWPLTATPRADRPDPPVFTSLVGGHESAVATWNAPARDGGAAITSYSVYAVGKGRMCTVPASAGPPYTCPISGLTNLTTYRMWVTAINEVGESLSSDTRTVTPAPVRPGPPLDLLGTAGNRRIHFAWKPPISTGTFPVLRYQLVISPSANSCVVSVDETSCAMTDLTPGGVYVAQVRAYSAAGWGAFSEWSPRVTVPVPPPPNIGVEVRRKAKDPDQVVVTGGTTGIKAGTALWVWIHGENDLGYLDSYQGAARPVVDADGTFTWERTAPVGRIFEVIWCTGPNVTGLCSHWTLL